MDQAGSTATRRLPKISLDIRDKLKRPSASFQREVTFSRFNKSLADDKSLAEFAYSCFRLECLVDKTYPKRIISD